MGFGLDEICSGHPPKTDFSLQAQNEIEISTSIWVEAAKHTHIQTYSLMTVVSYQLVRICGVKILRRRCGAFPLKHLLILKEAERPPTLRAEKSWVQGTYTGRVLLDAPNFPLGSAKWSQSWKWASMEGMGGGWRGWGVYWFNHLQPWWV